MNNDVYIGQKFGELEIIEKPIIISYSFRPSEEIVNCKCSCGCTVEVLISDLLDGKVVHCPNKMHDKSWSGLKNEKLYWTYTAMKSRCNNPNNKAYENYGAKGITVDPEWEESYEQFREWAYANGYDPSAPHGVCTLDRIDPNGNYSSENCRFVDMRLQNNNKTNNRYITFDGVTATVSDFANAFNIPRQLVRSRMDLLNWPIEDVFRTPQNHQPTSAIYFLNDSGKPISQFQKED